MQAQNKLRTWLRVALAKTRASVTNERGETITETLVSVLIGGLALLMLAVVLATTFNLVSNSRTYMNAYYTQSNAMAELTSSTESGTVSLVDSGGDAVKLDASEEAIVTVNYYTGEAAGLPVVSYSPTGGSGS